MDRHTTEMAVTQIAAIGLSLSSVEQWLRITSLVVAISFGVYKWVDKLTRNKNK
jgi:EamA domain-containing membrane protein RarD